MKARQTVDKFIGTAKDVFSVLKTESESLTDLDLQMLRSQLHMLEIETTNIQHFRELRLKDSETASDLEHIRRGRRRYQSS